MSNGDDEADAEASGDDAPDEAEGPVAELESRLDDAAASLEAAETEAGLDGVEDTLADIESDIEDADLPEPDEDDEDAEDPRAELEERLESLRGDLEDARGPYAEDVADVLEGAAGTLRDSEWTGDGADAAVDAADDFLEAAADHADVAVSAGEDVEAAAETVESAAAAIEDAGLDADDDAEAIAALLTAAETLEEGLEAAEVWDDLSVREQLDAEGFYDTLSPDNRKDFPPEWNAIKAYARDGDVEPVLLALEKLDDSDFYEEYVFDQLVRIGRDAEPAFDAMHERAQKRNEAPIEILGKIANDEACETLHEFIEDDGDRTLQQTTLRALGEIGSEDSTEPVAQRLAAEDEAVRSAAARSLGLIGDTRAIAPLEDVLADDEETNSVRASAAWALRQIGTEDALDALAGYEDDGAYLVEAEAKKVAGV